MQQRPRLQATHPRAAMRVLKPVFNPSLRAIAQLEVTPAAVACSRTNVANPGVGSVSNQVVITPALDPPDRNVQNNSAIDRDVIAAFASGFEE